MILFVFFVALLLCLICELLFGWLICLFCFVLRLIVACMVYLFVFVVVLCLVRHDCRLWLLVFGLLGLCAGCVLF